MNSTRSLAAWHVPRSPTVRPGRTSVAHYGSMRTRPELRTGAEPATALQVGRPGGGVVAVALYRCGMAAGEKKVTVTLDAELVARARTELGLVRESDRAVVERVLNAYLIGRQLDATQGRAGLSEQEAE